MSETTKGQFVLNPGTRRTQCAALCWRMFKGSLQVLLVTSRDTGRWVIPKGWPVPGQTPEGSARIEAREEAGVEGRIGSDCIGLYGYDKMMGTAQSIPCIVAVYPLQVFRLRRRYLESQQRRRKWFSLEKAAKKVDEAELRTLLLAFSPAVPAVAAPTQTADGTRP